MLPAARPDRLVLISGGSGITPVMAMLRTLVDEGHRGSISFVHYARTSADWLYEPEVHALAQRAAAPIDIHYRRTRGPGAARRLDAPRWGRWPATPPKLMSPYADRRRCWTRFGRPGRRSTATRSGCWPRPSRRRG